MEEKEYLKRLDSFARTQGNIKLWNIFLNIVETDYFQDKIKDIRKKCNITIIKPKRRSINLRPFEDSLSEKDRKYIKKELKSLCKKYSISYFDWGGVIFHYLFCNIVKKMDEDHNCYNMCLIANLAEEAREPFGKDVQDSDNIAHPIAIRISPYASKRDILDFVNKMYPEIKDYQEECVSSDKSIWYRRKGNARVRERNKFIYENKELPRKVIRKMVEEKFGETLDYEYVAKIISDEKKRRKET